MACFLFFFFLLFFVTFFPFIFLVLFCCFVLICITVIVAAIIIINPVFITHIALRDKTGHIVTHVILCGVECEIKSMNITLLWLMSRGLCCIGISVGDGCGQIGVWLVMRISLPTRHCRAETITS